MELIETLNASLQYLEQHLLEDADSVKAARHVGLSRFYLERTFASLTGMSVASISAHAGSRLRRRSSLQPTQR